MQWYDFHWECHIYNVGPQKCINVCLHQTIQCTSNLTPVDWYPAGGGMLVFQTNIRELNFFETKLLVPQM